MKLRDLLEFRCSMTMKDVGIFLILGVTFFFAGIMQWERHDGFVNWLFFLLGMSMMGIGFGVLIERLTSEKALKKQKVTVS